MKKLRTMGGAEALLLDSGQTLPTPVTRCKIVTPVTLCSLRVSHLGG